MVSQSSQSDYKVGKRIECNGHYGTIKYVGPVDGYPGEWLGIDWDREERGKHNGNVKGKQYFTTRLPKSGSLVRKEKANLGRCLYDSINTRYGYKESEETLRKSKDELIKFQQKINAPFLEFVGFDEVTEKQRDYQSLEVVNVRLQNVSTIGNISIFCPNIKEIDISKNLISSWSDVFDICGQLKKLRWINLSENLLSLPEITDKNRYPSVNVLIVGHMELTFDELNVLSSVFPNIEELRAPFNRITSVNLGADHNFKRLKYLDLEGNLIEEWSRVMNLSYIKTLEHLTIENIRLKWIRFDSDYDYFSNLDTLNISDNLITEWRSIGELNKLPSLKHLRFYKNPLLENENVATREQIVVAMIKNLKSYNGRFIKNDERRGAEYDYIKKYALDWIKCRTDEEKQQFLAHHNRFQELIDLYGLPDEEELVTKPKIIESSLINVTFQYDDRVLVKKLPNNILVQKLILLIQKTFKLKTRPTLVYSSAKQPDINIELSDEMKEIGYYSIEDGDIIIVHIN